MVKKSKIQTPDWILKGEVGPKKKESGKIFKVKICPNCKSDQVNVVIGESGLWKCNNCSWKGKGIVEKEYDEEEFMKYLDERGEEFYE